MKCALQTANGLPGRTTGRLVFQRTPHKGNEIAA
jgi:hypothetical protein